MTTRLLGRAGNILFRPTECKRGSQFGSETVAQYKTLASFPGLARSSLAVRNPRILYGFLVLKKQFCVKMFQAVHNNC